VALQETDSSMSIESLILEEADYQAKLLRGPRSSLKAEFRDIEKRKSEIEARLQAGNLAFERLGNFDPASGRISNVPVAGFRKKLDRACIPSVAILATTFCAAASADLPIPSR
jgi:hypothetical protein